MPAERYKIYPYADGLEVRFTDIRVERSKEEPAIWLQRNIRNKPHAAYVLPLSRAFQLGDDVSLMECAIKAADTLYTDVSKDKVHSIMTILQNHLDELIQMPPPIPKTIEQELGELDSLGMVLSHGGERLH